MDSTVETQKAIDLVPAARREILMILQHDTTTSAIGGVNAVLERLVNDVISVGRDNAANQPTGNPKSEEPPQCWCNAGYKRADCPTHGSVVAAEDVAGEMWRIERFADYIGVFHQRRRIARFDLGEWNALGHLLHPLIDEHVSCVSRLQKQITRYKTAWEQTESVRLQETCRAEEAEAKLKQLAPYHES